MFWSKNKKKHVYPRKPQFYYIKVGCKGVFVTHTCFRDAIILYKNGTSSGSKYHGRVYMMLCHCSMVMYNLKIPTRVTSSQSLASRMRHNSHRGRVFLSL